MKIRMNKRVFLSLFSLICFLNTFACDRERSNPVDPQTTVASEKPKTPQGLRAQPSVNKILVSWQAVRAPDLAGYAVYRADESNGKYLFVPGEGDTTLEITTGKLNYTDSLQISEQTFFYRVAAVDTFGLRSEFSEFVGATSLKDLVSPGIPSNVSVVADPKKPGRIVIRWSQPTLDETGDKLTGMNGYVIFRSEEGNGFEPIDTLGIELSEFVDIGLRSWVNYSYRILAFDKNGNESQFSIPLSAQTIGLATPNGLTAKSSSDGIAIEWRAVEDRKLYGYMVYRSQRSDANYAELESVEGSDFTTGQTTYIDSNLQAGDTYFYKVRAIGEGGIFSELSTFVGATVRLDQVAPAPPQNLSAIPSEEFFDRVNLRWNAPVTDSDGEDLSGLENFVLFRSRGVSSSFVPVDTLNFREKDYADEGLEVLTTYYYTVSALDGVGNESARASVVQVRTKGPDQVAPAPPQNLSAIADRDDYSRITLTWAGSTQDSDGGQLTGLNGYSVFRSEGSTNSFQRVAEVASDVREYVDFGLNQLTTYYYTVSALDVAQNESARAPVVQVRTEGPDQVAPAPPQNLSAIADKDDYSQITLTWAGSSQDSDGGQLTGLKGYSVFRSEGSTNSFQRVAEVASDVREYVDFELNQLTTYYYTVSALDGVGNESARASLVQVRTEGPDQVAPAPPQNLSAIPSEEFFDRVTLRWNAPATDSDGEDLSGLESFVLFRSRGGNSSFVPVDTLNFRQKDYTDEGLELLTTYYYTVSALDGAENESARASVVQVRTEGPDQVAPAPPQNLSAIADKDNYGQITLTWNLPTENAIGNPLEDLALIVVFRSENGSGGFAVVDTLGGEQQQFVDTELSASTNYYYSLSAVDQSGNESLRVNSVRVVTNGPDVLAPASPSNLFVEVAEQNFGIATLNWDEPKVDENGSKLKDLQGYFVFRSKGDMSSFKKIAVIGVEFLEYEDTELDDFTVYFYEVSAFDSSGNESYRSTAFRIITSGADRIAPAIPANLSVFPSEENYGQADLSWDRPKFDVEGELLEDLSSYIIFRSTSAINSMVAIDTVGSDVEVYSDTGLVHRKNYFYTITAIDELQNESGRAAIVAVVAPGRDVVAPSSPTSLYAEAHAVDNQIILTWNAPNVDSNGGDLSGLSNYVILRSVGVGSQFSVIDTISSDQTRYVDDLGLLGATEYRYQIQALDQEGNRSLFSDISSATTAGIEMPRDVTAIAGIGQILLSWNSSSEDALLGYNVYRTQRTDTEFERLVGIENTSFSTGKSTFIDSNLIAGSIYFYRISVVTTKGESDQSAFVSATVQLDNRPPNAPNFLEGEAVVGDPEKLDLTWAPPTTDYDGSIITGVALYNVYRADVATGPFEKVAATIVAAYQDTGLSSVTTYYYRVTAVDNSGNSSLNSSSIGVTTGGVARPSGVKISASTPSSLAEPPEVSLSWEKSVGAILYYEIERTAIENSNSDEDYTAIGDNTLNTAFVDNTVSRARIYYYRIRARDVDDRVSEWTEIVSVEVKN